MRKLLLIIGLSLVSTAAFASMEVNESNFKEVLKSNKTVLMMVYKHGCSWCVKAEPIVAEFEAKNPGVVVAKLDGVKETRLRESLSIYTGTPTFVKYVDGKEVGGWVGVLDIDRMNNEFDNPKPLDHRKPNPQPQGQTNFELMQFLSFLEKMMILNFVISIIALVASFRRSK